MFSPSPPAKESFWMFKNTGQIKNTSLEGNQKINSFTQLSSNSHLHYTQTIFETLQNRLGILVNHYIVLLYYIIMTKTFICFCSIIISPENLCLINIQLMKFFKFLALHIRCITHMPRCLLSITTIQLYNASQCIICNFF